MAVKTKISLLMPLESNFYHFILLFTVVQFYKCIEFMDIWFTWRWILPHFFPWNHLATDTFIQVHHWAPLKISFVTHFTVIWHNGVMFMWLYTSVLICRQKICCCIIFIIKSNLCVNYFFYPKLWVFFSSIERLFSV